MMKLEDAAHRAAHGRAWIYLWAHLAAHMFVRAYEEPALRRQFGQAFDAYRAHVPRWWPRLRPWTPRMSAARGVERSGQPHRIS
jgi:hypothetical protein